MAHALQAEIDKTDAAIDALVYELYGLRAEEVRVLWRGRINAGSRALHRFPVLCNRLS